MVRQDKVSLRYGKAIFAYFGKGDKALSTIEELEKFWAVYHSSTDLQRLMGRGLASEAQRRQIVEDIVKKLGASDATKKILVVLGENGRISSLEGIISVLKQLSLESKGVQPLRVESAIELKAPDRKKVEEKFQKILGKPVEAEYVSNAALYGGLRVNSGSRTFDGTLSGWLTSMEENLVGGSHGNPTR